MGTRCIFKVIETEQGRKKTIARVLSNFHKKYARVGTENQNQSSNKKK